MNTEEKRLLHGLYFHREMIGEGMIYSAEELAWLARTPIPHGRRWQTDDGKLQKVQGTGQGNWLTEYSALTAQAMRPLKYLHDAGYIRIETGRLGDSSRIAVTKEGADLARELDTRFGRFSLWYKENKDGVLGLLITVLVSALTAAITSQLGDG